MLVDLRILRTSYGSMYRTCVSQFSSVVSRTMEWSRIVYFPLHIVRRTHEILRKRTLRYSDLGFQKEYEDIRQQGS